MFDYLDRAGLTFGRWMKQAPYSPHCGVLWEPSEGKGFGLFGRFAATDGDPSFIHYFYELGVGGKSVGAKRPNDSYGFGTYYIDVTHPNLVTPAGTKELLRPEKGLELYYSLALTPWAHLSPDFQVVHGISANNVFAHITQGVPLRNIETAVVFGLRLNLVF